MKANEFKSTDLEGHFIMASFLPIYLCSNLSFNHYWDGKLAMKQSMVLLKMQHKEFYMQERSRRPFYCGFLSAKLPMLEPLVQPLLGREVSNEA